jgi:hypothetical protein
MRVVVVVAAVMVVEVVETMVGVAVVVVGVMVVEVVDKWELQYSDSNSSTAGAVAVVGRIFEHCLPYCLCLVCVVFYFTPVLNTAFTARTWKDRDNFRHAGRSRDCCRQDKGQERRSATSCSSAKQQHFATLNKVHGGVNQVSMPAYLVITCPNAEKKGVAA